MAKADNAKKLMEMLHIHERISTNEAVELLKISPASARRLFLHLENEGKLVRTYGGARIIENEPMEYRFENLERKNLQKKQEIAKKACTLVEEGDIIYLDSGTTMYQFSLALSEQLKEKKLRNIHVITNSMANQAALQNDCDIVVIGGIYRPYRMAFAGYMSEIFINQFRVKKSFLGADGFHMDHGFMTTDIETAKLNEVAIKNSDVSFVLIDSEKLGVSSFISYASPRDITLTIIDGGMSAKAKKMCESAGLRFYQGC